MTRGSMLFTCVAFKNANRTYGLWSRLIAWWTRGKYSHVELWLSGSPEQALCYSSREGCGTAFKRIDLRASYDVITVDENRNIAAQIFKNCYHQGHKSYDWLGLLGFIGPIKMHDDADRFCSEVVFEQLEKAGLITSEEKRWKVSPNELFAILEHKFGPAWNVSS